MHDLLLFIVGIWPQETADVLLSSLHDCMLLQVRQLPQQLPRQKAAELLKRALDGIFPHYVHANVTAGACIIHIIQLDTAFAAQGLSLCSIF